MMKKKTCTIIYVYSYQSLLLCVQYCQFITFTHKVRVETVLIGLTNNMHGRKKTSIFALQSAFTRGVSDVLLLQTVKPSNHRCLQRAEQRTGCY